MLSQRLAKCYFQIGQSIDADRSKKILANSITLFEKQLTELSAFAPTAENKVALKDLELIWEDYKKHLTLRSPNAEDAKSVMVINEEVLALAQKSTVQLEKHSGTVAGQLVNISGRQRMLSQRMAKFYQALNWGIAPAGVERQLEEARKVFIASFSDLINSPKNTIEIKQELNLARSQWFFFENALNARTNTSQNRIQLAYNVATTSERILQVMDNVTGMYEKLS